MRKFGWVGLVALGALTACGGAPEVTTQKVPLDNFVRIQAQTAVNESLSDPFSSFYRMSSAYVTPAGDYVVCGEVNAKSKLGGYVGFTPFYVRFSTDKGKVKTKAIQIDTFQAPQGCNSIARGVIPDAG